MGAAARKLAHVSVPARPALRLVPGTGRRRRARSLELRLTAMHVALVCVAILGAAGVARVALAVQAAEANVDAWTLKTELKAERLTLRGLEADRSSLATPSRIEMLACETLNMARPAEVCYIALPSDGAGDGGRDAVAVAQGVETRPEAAVSELLATLVDLAADEAQALLVGNMGLGQAR